MDTTGPPTVPLLAWLTPEARKIVRDIVTAYVYSSIPIRMINLDDFSFADRDAVISSTIRAIEGDIQIKTAIQAGNFDRLKEWTAQLTAYVVLSHTWLLGEDVEMSYQDVASHPSFWQSNEARVPFRTGKKAASFKKTQSFFVSVLKTFHQARYVWLDTICIDKSSTSELDESIRSMYRWYKNSMACIVYLSETKASPSLDGMESDRWFTRGWTLQEYLAPKVVRFFDCRWQLLSDSFPMLTSAERENDKYPYWHLPLGTFRGFTLIQQKVEMATGIPPYDGGPTEDVNIILSGAQIIQQMQWAARRETTRPEDRAYGLMGIFQVNFPIAYGEGRERAFFRLCEAILATKPAEQVCALLLWAGKPVSRSVHTSRMLPSGPDCYTNGIQFNEPQPSIARAVSNWFSHATKRLSFEPTVLTHIGLRMRLLLVRAVLAPSGQAGAFDGHLVHFKLGHNAQSFKPLNVHLHASYSAYPIAREIYPSGPSQTAMNNTVAEHPQFIFAIYTFGEDNMNAYIPRSGFGFILAWYPPVNNQWLKDSDMALMFLGAQSKIDTQRPIVFEGQVNSKNGFSTVVKTLLGSESMMLASLYM